MWAAQVSKLLQYSPTTRLTAIDALTHSFFYELRDPATRMPNGAPGRPSPGDCFTTCTP